MNEISEIKKIEYSIRTRILDVLLTTQGKIDLKKFIHTDTEIINLQKELQEVLNRN